MDTPLTTEVPDWAIERALERAGLGGGTFGWSVGEVRGHPRTGWSMMTMLAATLIAQHEEAPFAKIAKELVREVYGDPRNDSGQLMLGDGPARVDAILTGKGSDYWEMRLALAALKRGIEIGGGK